MMDETSTLGKELKRKCGHVAMDSDSQLFNLRTGDETTLPLNTEQLEETSFNTAAGVSTSCLTTAELQQHWRAVKQGIRSVKLLFQIPSARTIEHTISRYVVYQIIVIRSGSYDCKHVTIERRYSDFLHLHHELLRDFSEELEDIALPKKRLMGNFSEENITERRVTLCDYITQLYSLRYIRRSPAFIAFFTHPELKTAYNMLRGGQYSKALEVLQNALVLQEKLCSHDSSLLVPTLCALLVCQRDLENFHAAFQTGDRALPAIRRYGLSRYRSPLLEAMVDLRYKLHLPVAQLQEELIRVQNSSNGPEPLSLKQLVVQEFT
ncbi:sorting nexin-20 isoform X1 [Silurus asotus]|uniref:Sorting nexin-20 isoform X1 n=1 Tax=Silurus asotus TaxID=30991 RepID=A0AAD5B2S4_SILAS|nr:sorting nexin-20 isoform X1 [Silurus asotus]